MAELKGWKIALLYVVLLLFVVSCLTSCYTHKKAQQQFGRAAATYPELPAEYCARIYPPKDSLIKGDTVITFDTLWGASEIHFDTVYSFRKDTVFITKIVPGKTIIQTITVKDTIQIVNTAEVDYWKIQANKAINLATDKTKESDKWKRIAKKRWWIILGMGAGIALGIFVLIRRKLVKKVTG